MVRFRHQKEAFCLLPVRFYLFFFFFCTLQPRSRDLVLENISSFNTVQGNSKEFGIHHDFSSKNFYHLKYTLHLDMKGQQEKWLSRPYLFGGSYFFIQFLKERKQGEKQCVFLQLQYRDNFSFSGRARLTAWVHWLELKEKILILMTST